MQRPFIYLLLVALQFCIISTAYYFAVVSRIPYNAPPDSYHDLLLESIAGQKIIIDGGSSSHTGIDSQMIEAAFGLPVVNVADSAGHPLFFKAARLDRAAQPGDVIILPLEWNHYAAEGATDVFVKRLFGPINRYFWSLGPLERIETVFSIPPRQVVHEFRRPNALRNMGFSERRESLRSHLAKARSAHSGGGADLKAAVDLDDSVKAMTCDAYLFSFAAGPGLKVSHYFEKSLRRLRKLRDRGVTVIFTWPSVVGDDCYTSDPRYRAFMADVERAITEGGFPVVGKPEDSRFPRRLIYDTYYHVNAEGRALRTRRLIEAVREAGLIRPLAAGVPVARQMEAVILKNLEQLDEVIRTSLGEWSGGHLAVGASTSGRFLDFKEGWYAREKWGRWSEGRRSVLKFRMPATSDTATLRVWGVYYSDPEDTEVLVNDRSVGSFRFDPNRYTEIPVSVGPPEAGEGIVTVTFKHRNPVSPLELGQSKDARKLKLAITALELVLG